MGSASWEGSCKEGKVSAHSGTPLEQRKWGALQPQRGAQQHMLRRQNGENSPQRSVPTSNPQPEMLVSVPAVASGFWVLRLRLHRSDPREKTGADCHKGTLRRLV